MQAEPSQSPSPIKQNIRVNSPSLPESNEVSPAKADNTANKPKVVNNGMLNIFY